MNALIEHAVVRYHVRRISRHEQALDVRINGEQRLRQVPAIHIGHHHVGYEQVNLATVFLGEADGFPWRGSGQDSVTLLLKHSLGQFQDGGFILRQQNSLVTAICRLRYDFHFCRLLGVAHMPGQVDRERCSMSRLAENVNESFVLFDDAVDRCQPEAGAFANTFGSEKRLEDIASVSLSMPQPSSLSASII